MLVGQTHVDGYLTDLVSIYPTILQISPSPSVVLIECNIPQGKFGVRIIVRLAAELRARSGRIRYITGQKMFLN